MRSDPLALPLAVLRLRGAAADAPDGARGQIEVSYVPRGEEWTLAVSDTGIGMPKSRSEAVPGLGSSIVQAIAAQLGAKVVLSDKAPGTRVSIVRAAAAAGGLAGKSAPPTMAV